MGITTTDHCIRCRTIIFDLGRVLVQVDFKGGLLRYYTASHQADDREILEQAFKDNTFIAFTTGKMEPIQFYQEIQSRYKLNISYEMFVHEWCTIITPMTGIAELVTQLSKQYSLSILSDTDPLHWQYCWQHFHFLHLFANPTLSFKTGFLKPDLRCYQLAAKNAATAMENCLFIDDREINVLGAREAGMPALQFSGVEALRQQLRNLKII